jgi:hypothetical protein
VFRNTGYSLPLSQTDFLSCAATMLVSAAGYASMIILT